jgi:hypothetical protein
MCRARRASGRQDACCSVSSLNPVACFGPVHRRRAYPICGDVSQVPAEAPPHKREIHYAGRHHRQSRRDATDLSGTNAHRGHSRIVRLSVPVSRSTTAISTTDSSVLPQNRPHHAHDRLREGHPRSLPQIGAQGSRITPNWRHLTGFARKSGRGAWRERGGSWQASPYPAAGGRTTSTTSAFGLRRWSFSR